MAVTQVREARAWGPGDHGDLASSGCVLGAFLPGGLWGMEDELVKFFRCSLSPPSSPPIYFY